LLSSVFARFIPSVEEKNMDDVARRIAEMGFQSASDLAQQLLTLSTGILALSITFTKDIVKDATRSPLWILKVAWVLYLLSICCGIWTKMALTGTLMPQQGTTIEQRLTFDSNVLTPAKLQIITFILGVTLIIVYGARSLRRIGRASNESNNEIGKD
jgi:hypothetical protein